MAVVAIVILAIFVVIGAGSIYSAGHHAGSKSGVTTLSIDKKG